MLKDTVSIFKQIQSVSGRIDKESILKNNINNEEFKFILEFLYNPYKLTGIKVKKLLKYINFTSDKVKQFKDVHEAIDYITVNCTGRDEDVMVIANFINTYDTDINSPVHDFLQDLFTKSFKCGITAATINKVFKYTFIPEFDVMLAEKFIETKKIKGEKKIVEHWRRYIDQLVVATTKLDGNRCAVFVNYDGGVKLFSREGHELEGFVELEEAFKQFPSGLVYDGEIIATNEENLNSKDLFQKTSKVVRKKGIKKGVEFHAFDLIPINEFKNGYYDMECVRRKEILQRTINMINHPLVFNVDPLYVGIFDKEMIDELADKAKSNGEEGIMVQLANAGYSCKRVFDILKCKSFESADLKCIDIYEGKTGKNIGRLGGVVLDYHGYPINVGGGFSDEQRILYWSNPELILGKIIEINYFEEFQDENGKLDLRFATIKTIREDKTEPSYY